MDKIATNQLEIVAEENKNLLTVTNGNMVEFFTEKQKNVIRKLKQNDLQRLNIIYGSVRSGKTWITLVVYAAWVASMPLDGNYLMVGRTMTTLKRNCLDLLQQIVGMNNFTYSTSNKIGFLFGRKIYLEGSNDSRSEGKIRGITLQGAYVDEITLIDKEFFAMLLSRLSESGAKLFGSTNPDSPSHWLKTEYIDRTDEIDLYVEKYTIDDNTFLDPEYVKQIKAEYTGVFYDRFILGNFVLAEGLIYPMYQQAIVNTIPEEKPLKTVFSMDYGTMNAFAVLQWNLYGNKWIAVNGYYYSGRETGVQKTDAEYLKDMEKTFAEPIKQVREVREQTGLSEKLEVIIDPSAASFITLLQKTDWAKVRRADNDVLNGIRETATAMNTGKIAVFSGIKEWAIEAGGYVWDDKSIDEKPLKINDHYMDATRYLVMTKKLVEKRTITDRDKKNLEFL